MFDHVFESFLCKQHEEADALVRQSDLVRIVPVTPQHFAATLRCRGLVRKAGGDTVDFHDQFDFGIFFPADYLRRINPAEVVTWFGPRNIFHPNISDRFPVVCVGHLAPGTPLVEIVHQVHEIVTYRKVTMREDDALNLAACQWARRNQHRFPVDARPLKRRSLPLVVENLDAEAIRK